MKRKAVVSLLLTASMVIGIFAGCGSKDREGSAGKDKGTSVSVISDIDSDMADFALNDIKTALTDNEMVVQNDDAKWTIELKGTDDSLDQQAYKIDTNGKKITVTGGDENGLMYGGLEVAEQINLTESIRGVADTEDSPDIIKRGVRLNTPMDMRTPDYSAPGDSFQANIEDVWNIDYWHQYFDFLARNRYNVFTMWTLNPMPSMVKVADYPDIALDDVYKTTMAFDDTYSGTGNDNFRKVMLEEGNYEIVKKMTIDDKIAFWKEVMAYAKSRGIEFDIYFQNVDVFGEMGMFGEPGKYGITPDINNEVTKDYMRKSIAAMVETYPDLDGIGPVAGENMPTIPQDDPLQNDRFIWDTYGQGINDALAKEPDRQFNVIYSGVDIGDYWNGLADNATLCQRAGFASQHMNADADLMTVRLGGHQSSAAKKMASDNSDTDMKTSILDEMPENVPIYMDIRNEDAYLLRLGDVDYIRQILKNFPKRDPYTCYTLGFAGYCQFVEHGYADESLNGSLYMNKHWYLYELVGRLGYDLDLTDEYFEKIFCSHFSDVDKEKVQKLFTGLTKASGQVREVNKMNYVISSDSAFYPELAVSHPNTFGYLSVKRFMKSDAAEEGSNYMSIADYIAAYAKNKKEPDTDMVTPVAACKTMTDTSKELMKIVTELEKDKPSEYSSDTEREFYDTLDDVKAWAYWGNYYSEKINGAIALGIYDKTQDKSYQEEAVTHLKNALTQWESFSDIYYSHYIGQRFGRHGYWDAANLKAGVEKDIKIAQTWTVRSSDGTTQASGKKVTEADTSLGNVYQGLYNIIGHKGDTTLQFDTFEIDQNGKITGCVESSGMTGFIGTVDANGHFTCDLTRMKGGTVIGDIDENYHVTGTMSARGIEMTFEGDLIP